MFGMAEAADQGDDIEAELVVGQGEEGFGFGAVGAVVAGAVRVGAAAELQGQAGDGVEGGDGAAIRCTPSKGGGHIPGSEWRPV